MNFPQSPHGITRPSAEALPRIAVIGYSGLSRLVHTVVPDYAQRARIDIADLVFDEAIALGQRLNRDQSADVIVSAGANATVLRSALSLPVVTIKISGYDVLSALLKARRYSERVGVVTFREPIPELEQIKDLLRIEISQRTYSTIDDATDCFHALAHQGYRVIVGSSLVVDLAERQGITGVLIYSATSVRQAIEDAIEIARVQRLEARRFEQLNGVLRHLHEAVLAVDTRERITALNPLMERVLDSPAERALGRTLTEFLPELPLTGTIERGAERPDEVIQLRGQTWVANRIPIREAGRVSGALLTLQDANAIQRADTKIRRQRHFRQLSARYRFQHIAGAGHAMQRAVRTAERYARTSSTVLITGESGTGKELFAQAIHNASARHGNPFVPINCAAFPESLLESELFGYDEGAFTGSRKGGKPGLFEVAHTGTIFLDEIGDMPVSLQTRMLRVLQEKEVVRLGSAQPIAVDVRIIAATHRALADLVVDGRFRDDLYYRINILRLHLPPLRERAEDIAPLALQLVHGALRRLGSGLPADQALAPLLPLLRAYRWPGNVRELENVAERLAVHLSQYPSVSGIDYDAIWSDFPEFASEAVAAVADAGLTDDAIRVALAHADGNRQEAARRLGISRTTLWRHLRGTDRAGHAPDGRMKSTR